MKNKKNIITKIDEFKQEQDIQNNLDLLTEMAKINRDEIPYDVCVNGGNSYGEGRKEHGKPHFHYADNIKKSDKFKLSVFIPTIEEWIKNKELIINSKDSSHPDWTGLSKEKKILMDWISKPNVLYPKYSNLYVIINQWNTLNIYNKNVSQVPHKEEDLF